jgi:replicative DNA helicase
MDDDQRMSGSLQENVLTVLCFDDEYCKIVRSAVTPHLFESSVYKEIAGHAIDFIDQYGEAIKEHLPDHLENVLQGEDARKAAHYKRALDNLFLSRGAVNSEFVKTELQKFVRVQKFKSGLIRAVEMIEGGQGTIDEAETIMEKAMDAQIVSFEPGARLDSAEDVAAILDDPEEEGFTLGIEEFDRLGIYPRRKELLAFLAARGRGKSWFAIHCAKRALLQRWTPVIISLEMSQKRYTARMLQAFFSISRRHSLVKVTRLQKDREGNLDGLLREEIERQTMRDPDIRESLKKKAKRAFSKRKPVRIRSFPSGQLDMSMLRAYLEGLRRHEKITPDLLVVDYPRLMKLNPANLRLELGALNVALRGLADEYNCAVVILAQGNRESETAFLVTGEMVEEDISLKATADIVLTYSQTKLEQSLGLARLLADKVRNDETGALVLISQAYAVGQFCLESMRLVGDYWDTLRDKLGGNQAREERRGRRGAEDSEETPRRRRGEEDEQPPRRRRAPE